MINHNSHIKLFFQEDTVTNSAIWLVLYTLQTFLSLPTGMVIHMTLWVFFPFVYKELDSKSILLHNYCVGDYAFGVLYSYWRGSFNISKCKYKWIVLRVLYNAEFLVSLLGRAFKVMKNGIHFIICYSILGCELLKILIYAN